MSELFTHNTIIVNQQFTWTANAYELLDEEGHQIGRVQEENVGLFKKILKFTKWKSSLGFKLTYYDNDDKPILSLQRSVNLFPIVSKVTILDANDVIIGYFKQQFKLFKVNFEILDATENKIADLKGNWKGWDFEILDKAGNKIGMVNKEFEGLKSIFTSVDKYIVHIQKPDLSQDFKTIILGAAVAIDMILREYSG